MTQEDKNQPIPEPEDQEETQNSEPSSPESNAEASEQKESTSGPKESASNQEYSPESEQKAETEQNAESDFESQEQTATDTPKAAQPENEQSADNSEEQKNEPVAEESINNTAEESTSEENTASAPSTDESSDEREYYDFGEDSTDEIEDTDEHDDSQAETEEEMPDYQNFTREQLVEALEELVEKENVLEHKRQIALIKVSYLNKRDIEKQEDLEKRSEEEKQKAEKENPEETTETKETEEKASGKDELEERFNQAFAKYKEKKAKYLEEQERIQQENLARKKEILEELRKLINSEEMLKKTYDDFKALQEKWKEIGRVPKSEVNELWKNYHFLVEKFFDKVKINKELRDLDLKKNLEQKIELCERAEELILEPSVNKSFKELQALHDKYRQIGPVPADKKEEVWTRFKSATEKIHERRRKHYQELQQKQEKNLEAKTALCEKIEEILKREINTVKEWNQTSDEVKELMKVWRSIGFVPRRYNESIWNRFKTSVDTFFENKKEFFKKLKEEQQDNYNKKLNLCHEAEALQDSTDWKNTTRELIRLQKEWKKIGPVSRKHSEKLWKRFRTANDKFFNARDEHFKNQKANEKENLKKKEELIEEIKNYQFGYDKDENLKALKDFQRRWMEIGFVPFEKKDEIQKQYQETINKRMDELSISSTEVNAENYKTHVENLKEKPGSKQQLRKERSKLVARVNKLKKDVQLWGNNTGFLANTKNANLLKKEFQEKIDKAKREIALLEAQIKVLDSEE